MHTHFSFMAGLNIFMAVLIIGTLWRLAAYHAISSTNPKVSHLGCAMSFQY